MNKRSLLVVEDDHCVAELLHVVLTQDGVDVTIVSNAEAARKALAALVYDAVVIDVRLPGRENGFALAAAVAGQGYGIVLITGDHNLAEALARSGYPYLLKPFRVERLYRAIEQAIEGVAQETRRKGVT